MRDRPEELEEELSQRAQELRDLVRHLMAAREEEKARVARELHDEMGSSLTAVNMATMGIISGMQQLVVARGMAPATIIERM